MSTVLIGIDDTDNPTSPGTGHLARELSAECVRRGLQPVGVTRHQFLLDPRIPYTSHNSGACVAVRSANGVEAVEFAFQFVAERAAPGSDPGVCVAPIDAILSVVMQFGWAAAHAVLTTEEAIRLGESSGLALRAVGGTGQGVIGALGSVGQRGRGQEGRFIDLPGLRDLHGCIALRALRAIGIDVIPVTSGRLPASDDRCDTLSWVRPRLVGGKPGLPVEWSEHNHVWVPVDRKAAGSRH